MSRIVMEKPSRGLLARIADVWGRKPKQWTKVHAVPDGGLLVEQHTEGDRTHYVLLDKVTVDRLAANLPILREHAHNLGRMQTWELEEIA
ncbi:hypothetical protein [Corynebacterium glyciniphilum]|uniref:hypothetical protein n=1 Tax=Corynebacterium glyciniphilum TaxID=1404244 RepID=UPI00264F5C15|nr:hypothetical protein [Corynebacterium glyciniphilum]MDN6706932.1 hypothetical protein [Corynebacterium glyciniphilum]